MYSQQGGMIIENAKYLGARFDQHLVWGENVNSRKLIAISIEVSLNHSFVTVVLCMRASGQSGQLNCRTYKIRLLELRQTATHDDTLI